MRNQGYAQCKFVHLDEDALGLVSGGCSTCDYEMQPPMAMDEARIQGYFGLADGFSDIPVYMS
jgi:hypothetical protein